MAMAKLFWLRVLILLCIIAYLPSDSMAIGSIHIGGKTPGKVSDILRHVYPVVR